jgi:hypothetical protein
MGADIFGITAKISIKMINFATLKYQISINDKYYATR